MSSNSILVDVNIVFVDEFDVVVGLCGYGLEIVCYWEEWGGFIDFCQLDEVFGLFGKIDGSSVFLWLVMFENDDYLYL